MLDEPLSNLDAALKEMLRWEIRDAIKAAGIPAVWVTHDQVEALSVGDRLGVMEAGKLVQLASPEDCYLRPANRFAAGFLGAATFVECALRDGVAMSCFGELAVTGEGCVDGAVDLLLRPEDVEMSPAQGAGTGVVRSTSFEGGSWLYRVQHDKAGELLARTHHEIRFDLGERVDARLRRTHSFAVFPIASEGTTSSS